jgi:rhamnosyltransferase
MGPSESPAVSEFAREVLAILVLYGRTLGESITFRSLEAGRRRVGQRLDLFVYDNSAVASNPAPASGWQIEYRHDPTNPGVSRAYLEGARVAAERGKRWLLLLDQDTCFPGEAITVYADALRQYPAEVLFAPVLRAGGHILSPCAYRFPRGTPLKTTATGLQQLSGKSVLNSGMCISLAAYVNVGGHDPRLGLDFSDHEFIDRFKRRHARVRILPLECRHEFSGALRPGVEASLRRFRFFCLGVRHASRGGLQSALGAAMVAGRACRLAFRYRHPGFLRIAASTLIGGAGER